ncbi:MAG: hypothetical protein Q4D38_12715, partial [Planctomycetia bacterium]|nr:hypothetical protein [Planctomycetia bacterium]
FAKYAEEEPRIGRIQLIRQGKDTAGNKRFKRLDLAKGAIREKVLKAQNTDELDHIFDTDGEFVRWGVAESGQRKNGRISHE